MKKQLVLATLILTGALVLAGCGGGGSKSATKAGGKILTIELGPEVESIDPALNTTNDGANYLTYLFDNLLRIDKEGKVAPSLAEKYEVMKLPVTTLASTMTWEQLREAGNPLWMVNKSAKEIAKLQK